MTDLAHTKLPGDTMANHARWIAMIKLIRLAMWIAPRGDARDTLVGLIALWGREVMKQRRIKAAALGKHEGNHD